MEMRMKKWTVGLLAVCSLSLLAVDYDEGKITADFGKLFKLETFEYEGRNHIICRCQPNQ